MDARRDGSAKGGGSDRDSSAVHGEVGGTCRRRSAQCRSPCRMRRSEDDAGEGHPMSGARDYYDLRPRDPAAMQKWREEADELQRQREAAKRTMTEEAAETGAAAQLKAQVEQLQAEVASLRRGQQLYGEATEAVAAALNDDSDKIAEKIARLEVLIEKRSSEIWAFISRHLGSADAKQQKPFKFAGDKSDEPEPLDLPNPLRTVN